MELLRFSCCSCSYWGLLGLTIPFLSCDKKHFGPERGVFLSTCLTGLHRAPFLYPHPMDLGDDLPCLYSNKFLPFAVEPWRQRYIFIWSVGVSLRDYTVSTQKTLIWILHLILDYIYSSCLRGKHDGCNRVCFLLNSDFVA